jgi:hypothetical protein
MSSQPRADVLHVDRPATGETVCGLIPIHGWSFLTGAKPPEGDVEVWIEGCQKVTVQDRIPAGWVDPSEEWARRAGFRVTVNSFFLPNGSHSLYVRLSQRGTVRRTLEVPFRVENRGPLAEEVRRELVRYPRAKVIWTDPIDSTDFPFTEPGQKPWFDRPDASSQVAPLLEKHGLSSDMGAHFHHFLERGFIVLEGFVKPSVCDQVVTDLERCLTRGTFQYGYKGQRIEHLYKHSRSTYGLWTDPRIIRILSAIFDDLALPCQTLNFIHGSQQDVHQDTIHLTPYPAGYMCGVWVALEDIHPDAGPLVVYPGSHRLPRLYTAVVGMRKVRDDDWSEFPRLFTPRLKQMLAGANLEPVNYTPKKGSVLIWHENLAHGGSPRNNDSLTRKSMVSHYFARGGLAFYDAQGLPAILERQDLLAA